VKQDGKCLLNNYGAFVMLLPLGVHFMDIPVLIFMKISPTFLVLKERRKRIKVTST
jgi:hypothetical protein